MSPRRAASLFGSLSVFVCLSMIASSGAAAPPNGYGKRGRTILSSGLHAYRSNATNADPFGHEHSWSTGLALTALHFVVDNVAIGGTLVAGVSSLRRLHDSPSAHWYGFDLDGAYHVPMTARLSLRFWLWAGVRSSKTSRLFFANDRESLVGLLDRVERKTWIRLGLTPDLLIHLSPSVALQLGPCIVAWIPLHSGDRSKPDLSASTGLTYSFGPERETGARLGPARAFAARGHNLLTGAFGTSRGLFASVSYARFVYQGIAVGGYAHAGNPRDGAADAGVGLQAIGSLALAESASLVLTTRVGYRWAAFSDRDLPRSTVQELTLSLSVLPGIHLYEGLFLGVGPQVSTQLRLASTGASTANARYLQGGLTSALMGSF